MIRKLMTFALVLVLASPIRLVAQDAPPGPTPTVKKLAHDEKVVKDKLESLDQRMHALAAKIQEKQPEEAARLESAWKFIHDQLMKEDVEKVVAALESGKLFEALPSEQRVQQNLKLVLDILERQRQDDERDVEAKL